MILFSVSDTSMDSQMASAACPAAPETLLMAHGRVAKLVEIERRELRLAWWGGSGGEVKLGG
jgi:hypothetical protein